MPGLMLVKGKKNPIGIGVGTHQKQAIDMPHKSVYNSSMGYQFYH